MHFSQEEETRIVQAIKMAELRTSGEVRVYIERFCDHEDPVHRASELFTSNKMDQTRDRNGVLVYIARESRQFAIWGDSGIFARTGQRFWENERRLLRRYLQQDQSCDGICAVVQEIGDALHQHFPADKQDNPNELPDEIIYG
jgi:uncharacterized membrane protein